MKIQVTKSFTHTSSPRPFAVTERLTVPDELGAQWVAEGRAISLDPESKPVKRKRENAAR
jgi:hypothetical protein